MLKRDYIAVITDNFTAANCTSAIGGVSCSLPVPIQAGADTFPAKA